MTQDTDTQLEESRQKSAVRRRLLPFCLACLLIFLLLSGIIFICALRPVRAEAGAPAPEASAFCRFPFLPLRCESDLNDGSFSSIGTHEVRFSLFGVPLTSSLTVADTTPPSCTVRDLSVLGGSVKAEDFLTDAHDFSDFTVTMRADGALDTRGVHEVTLILTDSWGNRTEKTARLTVYGVSNEITLEAGCSPEEYRERIDALIPEAEIAAALTGTELAVPGQREAEIRIGGECFTLLLDIRDTTPPEADVRDAGTLLGRVPDVWDFLAEVRDASAVTAAFLEAPDVSSPGEREVSILLTDEAGNSAQTSARLRVYNIPSAVVLEAGCSQSDALDAILNGERGCALAEKYAFRTMPCGESVLSVRTPDGIFELSLTVRDTTPPSARGKTVVVYTGAASLPSAADFVENITDASAVTAAFDGQPDFTLPGLRGVSVRLTDEAGNESLIPAYLDVKNDRTPPTISGIRTLTAYAGSRISYKSGVTAADDDGTPVSVSVDSSAVQLTVPGKYTVVYTASDAFGNTSTQKATVQILEVTEDVVRPYAESILSRILTPGMTKREQARAIYDWMTANVSYVAYADKTYWLRAAYSGFTTGRGDCYVYYAMSRILLDCAGIDNMEICRDNPSKPHYWNLVNCGDGWYHFDTCPHYRNYPLTSFMLTDAEVRAYSESCVKDYYSFDASLYPATP